MKISTKGRYALRLMLDLAVHNTGENISLKDISSRQEISIKYLEQIVISLSRAGFVRSVRGSQGGYRLAREPKDYTVGSILRLIEGSLAPVSCLDDEPNECPRAEQCATSVSYTHLSGFRAVRRWHDANGNKSAFFLYGMSGVCSGG